MSESFHQHPLRGLTVDGVAIDEVARALGTPCYIYSAAAIRDAWQALDGAFAGRPHAIHYALKANSTLAIVRLMRALGSHVDANSMGEVDVALRCGFTPREIVFTGVGKSSAELERAVALDFHAINVESPGELDRLDRIAAAKGVKARVALRVNPDIDAESHPHISTGLRDNKFGVPIALARELFVDMTRRAGLTPVGVHIHIGSQITTLAPLAKAAHAASALARELLALGVPLEQIDFGGGLGISYDETPVPDRAAYVRTLVEAAGDIPLTLAIEPGRSIVGPAGVLVSTVVDIKHVPGGRRFVVLDAGMTELMRPALYGAYHRIEPVRPRAGASEPADVVGPICESTDRFARDRALAPLEVGDLVVVRDVGAYGAVLGSTYLRRPLPPEALVDGGTWTTIRRRQTLDELLQLEA
ncbi:MAG: diaminopimelate decarboxylase [Acidobacteria bacterium]|nr:diaminopimelate decarboxylase [Acidobacteriota bacterium]